MPRKPKPIASLTIVGQRPGEGPFDIVIEIGKPYELGPDEWACPVALRGLYDKLRDMHGVDAVQALCLAIQMTQYLLNGFKEDGGVLRFKGGDETEFPLEAYAFGPSTKAPPSP